MLKRPLNWDAPVHLLWAQATLPIYQMLHRGQTFASSYDLEDSPKTHPQNHNGIPFDTCPYHFTPIVLGWLKLDALTDVGENMRKLKLSCIANGVVNYVTPLENCLAVPQNVKYSVTI